MKYNAWLHLNMLSGEKGEKKNWVEERDSIFLRAGGT